MQYVLAVLFAIRSWLIPAALVVGLYVFGTWLQSYKQVSISQQYRDFTLVTSESSVRLDPRVGVREMRKNDIACWWVSADTPRQAFGRVVGVPGDQIAIVNSEVTVNGVATGKIGRNVGDRPAVMVPVDHLFVLSDGHQFDSLAVGPIPGGLLLGRMKGD